ncbi:MAG: hypothetical protein ACREF4_01370 [Gammaproteobacteria bacterium]
MSVTIEDLVARIKGHRCYNHPIFHDWAEVAPAPEAVGALFHQIQKFCASTRPGWSFPQALGELGLTKQSQLLEEIVESESDHGPQLATMAGFIVNRTARQALCPDLSNQAAVEATLKTFSDRLLGSLPGYDPTSGLTVQARRAIAVFDRRRLTDRESTLRNLGTALALEMISNQQLIPGEKHCLVDKGIYGVTMEDAEMHYLEEHWGEIGAEHQHEMNAIQAVAGVLDESTARDIVEGVDEFLDALSALWDVLDSSLLGSGYRDEVAA